MEGRIEGDRGGDEEKEEKEKEEEEEEEEGEEEGGSVPARQASPCISEEKTTNLHSENGVAARAAPK